MGAFAPPPRLIEALNGRGIETIALHDPHRAMARMLTTARDMESSQSSQKTDRALLFIACTDEPEVLGPMVEALRTYCPRAVCRYIDPANPGRMVPFPESSKDARADNGIASDRVRPARTTELRLTGAESASLTSEPEDDASITDDENATLTDEEMNMLLSDDWDLNGDGTRS